MTKQEFLSELESLLLDIPKEEREEALKYYEDYFEDAGAGMEQSIIDEIGIPRKVAETIKSDLNGNFDNKRGEFTENGYKDPIFEHKFEIDQGNVGDNEKSDQSNQDKTRHSEQTRNSGNTSQNVKYHNNSLGSDPSKVILIVLCIIGSPFIISILAVAVGIVASLGGIFIAFFAVAVALFIAGMILSVIGIIQLFTIPPVGVVLIGAGFLLIGLALLFMVVSVWICSKVLPALLKGIVSLCQKPFQRRSVSA